MKVKQRLMQLEKTRTPDLEYDRKMQAVIQEILESDPRPKSTYIDNPQLDSSENLRKRIFHDSEADDRLFAEMDRLNNKGHSIREIAEIINQPENVVHNRIDPSGFHAMYYAKGAKNEY